jgi:LmbE family N-acetylglucosaminyl deacetylase
MKLLLDPHGDDGALFANFTLQREKPDVVVVFDSYIQVRRGHKACDWEPRRNETMAALSVLGIRRSKLHFLGLSDDFQECGAVDAGNILDNIQARINVDAVTEVWIPLFQTLAHKQHNLVSLAGSDLFRNTKAKINFYSTYTTEGKTTSGEIVAPTGVEVRQKLLSLVHFKTQIEIDALGCWPHFIRDQNEYITRFVRDQSKEPETKSETRGEVLSNA